MTTTQQSLIDGITSDLILFAKSRFRLGIHDAMSLVYHSETFKLVCDVDNGLYTYSANYISDMLIDEVFTGKAKIEL